MGSRLFHVKGVWHLVPGMSVPGIAKPIVCPVQAVLDSGSDPCSLSDGVVRKL